MLIVTQKPENLWLIGTFNNYAFAIAISDTKNKYIINRKCIFDVGEWEILNEIVFRKLITTCPCGDNTPVAAGIVQSKLWILAQTHSYIASSGTPFKDCYQICSIDFETGKSESYKILNFHDFMNFNTPFCFKCHFLQITLFIDPSHNINDQEEKETIKFMVAPNRLNSFNRNPFNIHNFYFDINYSKKTCKFGNFNEAFIEKYSMWAGFINDESDSEPPNISVHVQSGGINFTVFNVFDEIEPLHICFQSFFRDQNGQLFCLLKKWVFLESDILLLIKLKFDYEQKIAWFEEITNFYSVTDMQNPENTSIFIDDNIILLQSPTTIITVINRVLTLSEIAYLTLQRIPSQPLPIKEKKKSLIKKFKKLFKKDPNAIYNPKIHGIWMSQKCLHTFFGIPSTVKIRHC